MDEPNAMTPIAAAKNLSDASRRKKHGEQTSIITVWGKLIKNYFRFGNGADGIFIRSCSGMGRLQKFWINLRSSLWFIPAGMVLGSIGLAIGLVELDVRWKMDLGERWPQAFGTNAEGARGILSAIATSMITVTGVVFSIVIVALSLASNQYSPRILRNFMRDRGTQVVLGMFVSAFTYSLLVLRTVRSGDDGSFVPSVSIAMAILMGLASIGFLVYFIHHISAGIQAATIIAAITNETRAAIEKHFPLETKAHEQRCLVELQNLKSEDWRAVFSLETGYIQSTAPEMAKFAAKKKIIIRLEKRIGEFVVDGTPLFSVAHGDAMTEKEIRKLHRYVAINEFRTIDQDPGFGIRQLVDMSLKALSPGVNDVSTAINCIDYLGAILHLLVQRHEPPKVEFAENAACIVGRWPSIEELMDTAFLQIRQSAKGHPAVILRMLKVIGCLLRAAAKLDYQIALLRHVDLLEEITEQSVHSRADRQAISDRIAKVRNTDMSDAASKASR